MFSEKLNHTNVRYLELEGKSEIILKNGYIFTRNCEKLQL